MSSFDGFDGKYRVCIRMCVCVCTYRAKMMRDYQLR